MTAITGGCLCGAVRYEARAAPIATAVCHCKDCQVQGGSAFSIVIVVPSDAVDSSGALKTYEDRGESGNIVARQFCPECGSPIFSRLRSVPDITIIKAGTLDDTSQLTPQIHVWCASGQPWVPLDPSLPQFPRSPPTA